MSSPNTFGASFRLSGSGRLNPNADGSAASDSFSIGAGVWDKIEALFATGTADTLLAGGYGQVNQWFLDERTIIAGGTDNLDLSGTLVNNIGQTCTFTKIKFLLICIDTPDGVKELRIGPQAVANAFQGPFGGIVASSYKRVHTWDVVINHPYAGYAVGAGATDVLGISNPGAGPVTYRVLIFGVQ